MNKKKHLIASVLFMLITVSISAKNLSENPFPSEVNLVDNDCCAPTQSDFVVSTIQYIEDEDIEEIDLGFDVWLYLPEGFDAYEGMLFELDDIEYIELEEDCRPYMGATSDLVPSR